MSLARRATILALIFGTIFPQTGTAWAQTKDLTVVSPDKPSASQKPAAATKPQSDNNEPKLMVSLVPKGSTVIAVGDPYQFSIVSSQPSYGHVYVANASGKVQIWAENIKLASGKPVSIPPSGLKIVASPPSGDDKIYFFATRDRFKRGFFGGTTISKPADLQLNESTFLATMKSKLAKQKASRWAYTTQIIRVVD
jgi:hypothetical protein